ncbi:class I adenylate-forming enzyme family protein [Rhodopseudomonas palustris]|uniref:class I adenylate-forming enzyme family protein n=1 Tax=Rhodopseudomonas palustris TaxID=1076 RepID=UPI000E5A35D2|nr:fatty acid--CoA ligase family protein [Rhodopseudomonas palustris]QLH73530.1 long-chain fatty acid--CoA ligase [Rhodopseudomonas palustris]RIA00875.1 long-chain fatty acid--CoA ligase [Rhodopseudomonas palustris]
MSPREIVALRHYLTTDLTSRTLSDASDEIALADIARGTCFGGKLPELAGCSVLLSLSTQLVTGLAMIELDGVARRMLLCPPDVDMTYAADLIADAEIDAIVTDAPERWQDLGVSAIVTAGLPLQPAPPIAATHATSWLMLTSGTTGRPKIVAHTLAALTGAIVGDNVAKDASPIWATFYDIRRYGGLQIFLRAVLGGGSMVLSAPGEAIGDHLARLAARGVTHISGTPSHWRKALMNPAIGGFRPSYVRLSGEIADQAVLDGLRNAFPDASIGHAYASTEAGVGFAVNDGREGFPASLIGNAPGITMKVVDGSLRIKSTRTAHTYVGRSAPPLTDAGGFVDTGDIVELREDRYYFVGRRDGVINVGGLKVHPEEVEAVINQHPSVRMSRVRARRSPITGALVVAEAVLASVADAGRTGAIREAILANCRAALPPHKVPASIRFVQQLDVTASGKLARHA